MEPMFEMPLWACIPFVLMLLTIAIAPLVADRWWSRNINKLLISFLLGVPTALYLVLHGMSDEIEHQMLEEYLPFIILLMALFVITGGIHLSGDIRATPGINTLFLGIGYLLASLMGTTGAAMLLIRPLLDTNSQRQYKVHTVMFFIAAVANCGGLLTPLGDPPLFLLYLKGASFTWFLGLWKQWLFTGAVLLLVYYLLDRFHYYPKETFAARRSDLEEVKPLKVDGKFNLVYLLGVIAAVAFINAGFIPEMGEPDAPVWVKYLREIVLVSLIFLSMYTTKAQVRADNHYSWRPIIEVAVVFLGIFVTMIPAMSYLQANAASFGLTKPWHFFYATGALSSFLDNAPTALAFHGVASGLVASGQAMAEVAGIPEKLLEAISMGAVYFGAMTYIGNGPNFMVKSVAEEQGVKMPSFFGYMVKMSFIVLLPIYVAVQLIFF